VVNAVQKLSTSRLSFATTVIESFMDYAVRTSSALLPSQTIHGISEP